MELLEYCFTNMHDITIFLRPENPIIMIITIDFHQVSSNCNIAKHHRCTHIS